MTGTLKLSGTATLSARVFGSAASYIIPATGAVWLNIAALPASATVRLSYGADDVRGALAPAVVAQVC